MNLRKLLSLLAIFCTLTFSACLEDSDWPSGPSVTFKAFGLDQKIVNELKLYNNTLYAATDAGLFSRNLSTEADWQAVGMAGKNVKSVLALNATTLLASTSNPSQEEHLLYRSTTGGQSWEVVNSNWGGDFPEPINDFAYDATNNTLYACGAGVVAKSTDQGLSWTPVYGEWNSLASGLAFVRINPGTGDLWTGGQNSIEGFLLAKKAKASDQWQVWINLLPSPSVAKSIAFNPQEGQTVIIGGEDGMIHSSNGGTHWQTIMQNHAARFYFGLEYDQTIANRVYAVSWVKNFEEPQPLILLISENGGGNWWGYQHASSTLFGGAWDMVQKKEGTKTKLYIGLYKGGVYEATVD